MEAAEIIKFESIPLWRGVRSSPGVTETHPFELVLNSHGYIRQQITQDLREKIVNGYTRPDYTFITPPPGSSEWADRIGAAKIRSMLDVCGSLDDLSVMEIGAGNLVVARHLVQRYGISRYVAVDPTLPSLRDGVMESLPLFFPSQELTKQEFDLIVGFSCLEHVDNPLDFLLQAGSQLTRHGRIILTFPDVEAMLLHGDLNALVHEHLSYFTAMGFRNIAGRAGVEVVSLTSQNGLFTALLKRSDMGSTDAPRLPQSTLNQIRDSYHYVSNRLTSDVRSGLKDGKRISFHGACPGLNNFLWLSGLSDSDSVSVADGDRSKWGRYLPACHTVIRSPEDSQHLRADLIYVAATNFFSEIKQSLAAAGVMPDRIVPLTFNGERPQ